MGVPVGEATGDYPSLFKCRACWVYFESDEIVDTSCPECGFQSSNILTGYNTADPADWRAAPEAFDPNADADG